MHLDRDVDPDVKAITDLLEQKPERIDVSDMDVVISNCRWDKP